MFISKQSMALLVTEARNTALLAWHSSPVFQCSILNHRQQVYQHIRTAASDGCKDLMNYRRDFPHSA